MPTREVSLIARAFSRAFPNAPKENLRKAKLAAANGASPKQIAQIILAKGKSHA